MININQKWKGPEHYPGDAADYVPLG